MRLIDAYIDDDGHHLKDYLALQEWVRKVLWMYKKVELKQDRYQDVKMVMHVMRKHIELAATMIMSGQGNPEKVHKGLDSYNWQKMDGPVTVTPTAPPAVRQQIATALAEMAHKLMKMIDTESEEHPSRAQKLVRLQDWVTHVVLQMKMYDKLQTMEDANKLSVALKKKVEDTFVEMDDPQFVQLRPYSKPQLHEAFAGSPDDGQ